MIPMESADQTTTFDGASSRMVNVVVSTGRVCALITCLQEGPLPSRSVVRSHRRQVLSDDVDSNNGGEVGRTVMDLTKSVWPSMVHIISPDF